jgi:hypothetical protein
MRPRHLLILLALAAVPVALAVALAGGGGRGRAKGIPAAQVSLKLVGGTSAAVTACGVTHHYRVYPAGPTAIKFRGSISARDHWKVKLKLKACTAGAFRASGETGATLQTADTYEGSLTPPIAGFYFARAVVLRNGSLVARSTKRYFEIR